MKLPIHVSSAILRWVENGIIGKWSHMGEKHLERDVKVVEFWLPQNTTIIMGALMKNAQIAGEQKQNVIVKKKLSNMEIQLSLLSNYKVRIN